MVASLAETRGTSLSMTYLFINAGDEADPAPKASRLQEDTKSILAHGRNDVIQALCCSQLDTFKKYYAEFMNQYPKDEYIKVFPNLFSNNSQHYLLPHSEVYEQGVKEELFLSKYQRSLYNVKRLAAQPWWEPEQTNYSEYFKAIQENWQVIRAEGMAALEENHILFQDEAENLKDIGNWKQLELYVRGRRMDSSCAKVPQTCKLVANFPAARDCRRGQVKFSMMEPGTHIWPHCGPTNCRLRAHLGLVVPTNTYIRVAEETRVGRGVRIEKEHEKLTMQRGGHLSLQDKPLGKLRFPRNCCLP
uniref:Aspartyl/asparaginy/proline hydroxylase domain-containing protein n=1 Tax=Timema douglasi TaxID=61478 RepID=A0A7R8VUM1_TIMDO|nr:unnamed protein product [Timema douglasi]